MMDPRPMSQRDYEDAQAVTQVTPVSKVLFEGMELTPEQIEQIQAVRARAQYIKDGIDLEHVHTDVELVRVFENAFIRAKREVELNKALNS